MVFICYFCCYKKRLRRRLAKRREAKDGDEAAVNQQEMNQCLLNERQEQEPLPKLHNLIQKDGNAKQNEYTMHPPSTNTKGEDEDNLYEPVTEDQSSKPLLETTQQNPEAEVIYKTPSGASNRSGIVRLPTQNQPPKRYQDFPGMEILVSFRRLILCW